MKNSVSRNLRYSIFLRILITQVLLSFASLQSLEKNTHAQEYSFAEFLMKEQDFYRASVEFQRVYFQKEPGALKDYGIVKNAECYFAAGKFRDAYRYASQISSPEYAVRALWLKSFSAYYDGLYEKAMLPLIEIKNSHAEYQNYIFQLQEALKKGNAIPPRKNFPEKNISEKKIPLYLVSPVRELSELPLLLREWPLQNAKSPFLAGFYSAIVPGAGYAYAGSWGDFISAFLVTGFFSAGSALAFMNNETTMGAVLGGGALIFYTGGIYGSYKTAEKANHRNITDFERRLALFSFSYSWE